LTDTLTFQKSEKNSTFGKEYKLCSKSVIDDLFATGETMKQFPLRILFIKNPNHFSEKTTFQIVISVPKKKIRRAHERNRIKRVLRELVRLNKESLENTLINQNTKLAMFLIYSETTLLDYLILEKKINKLFQQLQISINNEKM
jgi:ribonuclease P protein component